jgi:hypothetical protein
LPTTTPRDAFERFAVPLRRAVSLIVPAGRGVLNEYPRPLRLNEDHSLSFPQQRPVRVTGERFYFDLIHGFRIVETDSDLEPFQVTTTRYFYTLLDRNHRELLAYHFHPDGADWCTYPHLHVGTASGVIDNKAHLATGPLPLQAFIRMLIEDPAIPVVSLRPDLERVLEVKGDRDAVD